MSTTITTTNKRRLSGKYALITGGSTGIGLATAKQFAEEGARVAVTGMDSERLAAAVRELPSNALALRADARSATDIATMFSEIQEHFGKLDILFVNAGVALPAPLEAVDGAHIDTIFDSNFKGAVFAIQRRCRSWREAAASWAAAPFSEG